MRIRETGWKNFGSGKEKNSVLNCLVHVFRIHKFLGLPNPLVRGTDTDSDLSIIIKQKW
jgi:hypothetical protein